MKLPFSGQNHIEHDPLYSLNSDHFLTANMLELKHETLKQVNVRAGPKTKLLSERSFPMQHYIQLHCFVFPPSTSFVLLTFERVQKPHLKRSKR